jgi:peptidoglycan/LPS O-acetylase OafA/YrhL
MAKSLQPKSHLLYLDGLRAIAAVYVVMHHAMLHYKLPLTNFSFVQKLSFFSLQFGHYAVNLFIVISGFSLMMPAVKKNYTITTQQFYWRRVKRILPPYYIALTFSALMITLFIGKESGTWWDLTLPLTWSNFLSHIFLVNDIFQSHAYKINHAMWSIPVECRIYILFPVLIFIWRKAGAAWSLLFAVFTAVVLFVVMLWLKRLYPDIDLMTSGVNPYIMLFTLGMLAADLSFSNSRLAQISNTLPWGAIMLITGTIFAIYYTKNTFTEGLTGIIKNELADVLFGIVCFCMLVLCSKANETATSRFLKRALSWQPLAFTGMFAYSIYLIHAPLLQLISVYLIPYLHFNPYLAAITLITGGTALIVGIAYVFFLLFEKPFLNKRPNEPLVQTEINAAVNPAP